LASSITPHQPYEHDLGSSKAFEFVQSCLNECLEDHGTSHKACRDDIAFLPSRLLHITQSGENLRLHETTAQESLRYCCLSYCWGADPPIKTTVASRRRMTEGFSNEILPRTLQDAIEVAVNLGIEYIWIDCLTIIQDDPEDVASEIGQMPLIFEKAFFTISASNAPNASSGFLRPDPVTTLFPDLLIKVRCRDGTLAQVVFQLPPIPESNPIDHRAWTLQERLLSPRLLDYTTHEVRWLCRSKLVTIDGTFDRTTDIPPLPKNVVYPYIRSPLAQGGFMLSELSPSPIFNGWPTIIEDYSLRKLTFSGDKLTALSALASEFAQSTKVRYLAGLWDERLDLQLLWQLADRNVLGTRPKPYRAPSWSWAAVDSRIEWKIRKTHPMVEFLETAVISEHTLAPFGAIKNAFIKLRGRTVTARWYYNCSSTFLHTDLTSTETQTQSQISRMGTSILSMSADANEDWRTAEQAAYKDVTLLMLVERKSPMFATYEGLVLTGFGEGEDSYQRVGIFIANRRFEWRDTKTLTLF
jgi:hypothetical protein